MTNREWFARAKYGLFIHFGLYALLGGEYRGRRTHNIAEWIMHDFDIPVSEYEQLALQFDPVNFDADRIARQAKGWGMEYIVITAKHHEGFALWDSEASDYNCAKASPCHRDLIREMAEACRKYGLQLGLYYSQAQDWHHPGGFSYRRDNSHKDYQRYLDEKCMPQLRELLTGYGPLCLVWFDTPMDTTPAQSKAMADLVHALQPDCLISGRIGNDLGDYLTLADNLIPRLPIDRLWEVPATTNETWGYNRYDDHWKSPQEIIKILVRICAQGGNYLLNIGPDGSGAFPQEAEQILDEVSRYVSANREAIVGTRAMKLYPYEPTWGDLTMKDYHLYVHIYKPQKIIGLMNIRAHVKRVTILETGQALPFECLDACEGNGMLEFILPEDYHDRGYYVVDIEMNDKEATFEPIM